MNYISTRDASKKKYSSAEVIKMGLAPDGGLFVPETIPTLTRSEIESLIPLSYPKRAAYVLGKFLTDYTYDELISDCENTYSEDVFRGGAAPLLHIHDNIHILELWHGPTAAFKDMALGLMPRLLSRALKKTGEKRTALILVATSGDTGKAALEGYRDIEGIDIAVFYPVDGVSKVQKLQMATQLGDNVDVCAIRGNFDDAQNGVKKIFSDSDIADKLNKMGYFLSSANSINWGRLAPQIVYYVSAYCDLVANGGIALGDEVNFSVPTGNFGNIFAAYIAKLMGLPISKLICSSNMNNVLTDFLDSGKYDRNRKFHLTMSPSMDILISSNLERLLYFMAGNEQTSGYMAELSKMGEYTVSSETLKKIREVFVGEYADEKETSDTIAEYFKCHSYLADTHTSVGLASAEKYIKSSGDKLPMIVDSTASPFKFAFDVYSSVKGEKCDDPLEALELLSSFSGVEIPYPLSGLEERKVRFTKVIDACDMANEVFEFAGRK